MHKASIDHMFYIIDNMWMISILLICFGFSIILKNIFLTNTMGYLLTTLYWFRLTNNVWTLGMMSINKI